VKFYVNRYFSTSGQLLGVQHEDSLCLGAATKWHSLAAIEDWEASGIRNQVVPAAISTSAWIVQRTEARWLTMSQVLMRIGEHGMTQAGLAWTEEMRVNGSTGEPVSACVSFGLMHASRGREYGREMGVLSLSCLFLTYLTIRSAFASIPAPHRASRLFASAIGLKQVGRVPSASIWNEQPVDEMIYAITREQWEQTIILGSDFQVQSVA
jgi:RimJ/RimL family protein N-acetyltransferase